MKMLVRSVILGLLFVIGGNYGQGFRRVPISFRQRLQNRIIQYRQRHTQTVCYETVGCFELPHSRSPLQKVPESPELIDTKFYLFRRNIDFAKPEVLYYDDDGISLSKSKFNKAQILKVFVHGYMSNWNEKGALLTANNILKLYDCNMILMDWSKGARGPQYATAAANTEVAGRQLGLLLLRMVDKGLDPKNIHLMGFSLGAHVAGTSSNILKKNGHLMGRITGLDAASPLFRGNHFRELDKKLDRSDARFVDVLHTDASPSVTDGFGLWEPIGHVDYFANGGQEQPGCKDTKGSVVVSSIEKSLTREIACSHIRSWQLYLESLENKVKNSTDTCKFVAFSCPGGLHSFERGHCFPNIGHKNSDSFLDLTYRSEIGMFGEDAKGEGVMYFNTRDTSPYCGTQLQASVQLSQNVISTKGVLEMKISYSKYRVAFYIVCDINDVIMTGTRMNGLAVAPHKTLTPDIKAIYATLTYYDVNYDRYANNTIAEPIFIDKIIIRDMYDNSWQYCGKNTIINENSIPNITLSRERC